MSSSTPTWISRIMTPSLPARLLGNQGNRGGSSRQAKAEAIERRRLREERLQRRWSQDKAAAEACDLGERRGLPRPSIDGNAIGRWERGVHHPDAFNGALLCELYGKSAVELDLVQMPPSESPVLDTLSVVDRRHFLQLLGAAGLSIAVPDPDQWERLEKAIRRSAALDNVLISELEAQTSSLHQLERQIPARHLYARVELHLDRLTDLLERAPARLKRRLVMTAGDTASLGGWIAWDMGDRESAARLYKIATLAAREGDDPVLRACLLAYGAPPHLARELLQSARSYIDGGAYPTALAWIDGREAEEAAAAGDAVAAPRLLEHGLRVYEASQPDEERTWTRFVDPTRMAGFAISTYARLGMTDSALRTATNVLGGLESGKKRAIVLADTADVYLQQQDLEAAEDGLQLADQALEAARETESTVGYDHLRRLPPRLEPWLQLSAARQLHDQLLRL